MDVDLTGHQGEAEGFVTTRSRLDAATGKVFAAVKSRGGRVGVESSRAVTLVEGASSPPLSECDED